MYLVIWVGCRHCRATLVVFANFSIVSSKWLPQSESQSHPNMNTNMHIWVALTLLWFDTHNMFWVLDVRMFENSKHQMIKVMKCFLMMILVQKCGVRRCLLQSLMYLVVTHICQRLHSPAIECLERYHQAAEQSRPLLKRTMSAIGHHNNCGTIQHGTLHWSSLLCGLACSH